MMSYPLIDEPRHWRPHGEGDGADAEKEADGLASSCHTTDVEGDGSQHRDETTVEDAKDEASGHKGHIDI